MLENIMSNNQIIAFDAKVKQADHQSQITYCDYAGGKFQINNQGVFYFGIDKDGNELAPRWICSPLYVTAKTRDAHNGEWGRLLEWQDDDGITHQWAMPLALLQGDASDVRRELVRLGLTISPGHHARDLLTSYVQVFPVEARARCVDKLGWHNKVFVTPKHAIGQSEEKIVFQNTNAIESSLSTSGSAEEWKNSIAKLAIGNSRLVFAIASAFAPTIARLAGEDSGGFHFRGASSSGKSTALNVAASVWGKPNSYIRLWRATANGLEGLAAMHNDGLLILDELSQLDPREAGEAAYLLANGQGKNRASKLGTIKAANKWALIFLSAGEESLATLMARIGQRCNAGQEIRLADIEADAGCGMGLFETLHQQLSPASLALTLKNYSSKYYGAVGETWLQFVVTNQDVLARLLNQGIQQFVDTVIDSDVTGQVIRVARRFALVGAAGELATQFNLTGWQKGESYAAAKKCFKAWLLAFGDKGNREDRAIKAQVRAFFELHGASRFDNANAPNNEKVVNRAGFYRTDDQGFRRFMVLTEVYKNELCQGFDQRTVTKILLECGWLIPTNDGKASHKPRIKGVGTPRLYVFSKKVLDAE